MNITLVQLLVHQLFCQRTFERLAPV